MSAQAQVPVREAVLREILFPSDLSPRSDRALDHARLLAQRFGARLTIYHAVEVPRSDLVEGPWDPEHEMWRRAERAARERLERRSPDLGVETRVVVERTTSAHRALVSLIRTTRPDLTVMATHGREGLAHLVLGSVTEMAIQHGRCPVLCVREPQHGAALPYRRILVPTDLSEASRRAFALAAILARGFEAEVVAVHVARVPVKRALTGVAEAVEAAVPTDATLRRFLDPEFAGLAVACRTPLGEAWDQIVEAARVEKADVIVMSTHGHDSLGDRVLGSHTERVARHAPCPVLVA